MLEPVSITETSGTALVGSLSSPNLISLKGRTRRFTVRRLSFFSFLETARSRFLSLPKILYCCPGRPSPFFSARTADVFSILLRFFRMAIMLVQLKTSKTFPFLIWPSLQKKDYSISLNCNLKAINPQIDDQKFPLKGLLPEGLGSFSDTNQDFSFGYVDISYFMIFRDLLF